MVALVCKNVR